MSDPAGLEWIKVDDDCYEARSLWHLDEGHPLWYRLVRREYGKRLRWFSQHDAELGEQRGGGPWVNLSTARAAVERYAVPFEAEARAEAERMRQKAGRVGLYAVQEGGRL